MTHSVETKNKFIEMRAEGRTFAQIAEDLNISYNTAVNWSRELSDNISAAKAFKKEELIEKYRMTKEKKLDMYGERLLAIQDELAKRDLSDIPTNKLFDMMVKCSKAFEAEAGSIEFLTDEDIEQLKEDREFHQKLELKREKYRRTREEFDAEMGY
jgi:hypothetical protein